MEEGAKEEEDGEVSTTWSNLTFEELVRANRDEFERLDLAEKDDRRAAEPTAALAAHWDAFYVKNKAAFFKDRHYFGRDYPELAALALAPLSACEWGCGAGNTVWGLLQHAPSWRFFAFDCSPAAVELVASRRHPRVECVVWDPANLLSPSPLAPISLDLSLFVFFLSALATEEALARVARECFAASAPGALAIVRDYALFDMTMLRFARKKNRKLAPRLYRRSDGTLARFFESHELDAAFVGAGFEIVRSGYECRELRNRKTGEKMYRNWVSAVYRKSGKKEEEKIK